MSDTIITVGNLSKRYRLGVIGATSLRESIERAWHRVCGRDPAIEMGKIGQAARPIKTLDPRPWTLDQGGGAEPPESLKSKVQSLVPMVQSLMSNV